MSKTVRSRRLDVIARAVDEDHLVLDRRLGRLHKLNRVSAFVWLRCDGVSTVASISAQLAESFGIADREARAVTRQALEQLDELELLER